MNIQDAKKIICISVLSGFLTGIIYLNIIAKSYILSTGFLDNQFLESFSANQLNTRIYIWHIIKLRLFPFILLSVFATTKYRKIVAVIFLIWTGFSFGLIITTAILKMGLKGIGLCIVGIMPHFIVYITVYIMLLLYMFTYPGARWNNTKTISAILFVLMGIISESYLNPVLLDIFLKLL